MERPARRTRRGSQTEPSMETLHEDGNDNDNNNDMYTPDRHDAPPRTQGDQDEFFFFSDDPWRNLIEYRDPRKIIELVGKVLEPALTIWFALLVVIITATHEDSPRINGGILVVYLCIQMYRKGFRLFRLDWKILLQWILVIAAYATLGALWTIPKWYLWSHDEHNTGTLLAEYDQCLEKDSARRDTCLWYVVHVHRGDFFTWMTYWPVSMLYTLMKDPLRIFFDYAFEQLRGVYVSILAQVLEANKIPLFQGH